MTHHHHKHAHYQLVGSLVVLPVLPSGQWIACLMFQACAIISYQLLSIINYQESIVVEAAVWEGLFSNAIVTHNTWEIRSKVQGLVSLVWLLHALRTDLYATSNHNNEQWFPNNPLDAPPHHRKRFVACWRTNLYVWRCLTILDENGWDWRACGHLLTW